MTEAEVQEALVHWLQEQGYSTSETCVVEGGNRVDVIGTADRHEWRIEVKGDYDKSGAQYNVNFDTGIGQLVKGITRIDGRVRYGIAIPFSRTERRDILSYRRILPKYSESAAFEALNIYLLLVRDNGTVESVAPPAVRTFLRKLGG